MKKLALASAIALTSAGAHAFPFSANGDILLPNPPGPDISITVPCASTWSGGTSGFALDVADTVSGTICLDPTGSGQPYVMIGLSLSSTAGNPLVWSNGAIQVATDWGSTTSGPGGWTAYSIIRASTAPISCSAKLTCGATLYSLPATLIMQ